MADRNSQINENYFIGKKTKDFFGKTLEQGDLIPAPPKTYNSPDVSHTIKEIFQEYLKDELPSYNMAKTMQTTCKENQRLKNYADSIVMMYDNYDEKLQDIASVEDIMMRNHARYVLKDDKIKEDSILANIVAMKARPIFRPLDENVKKKYPLIAAADIFHDDIYDRIDFQNHEPDAISKYFMSDQKSLPSDITAMLPQGLLGYQPVKAIPEKQERTQRSEWEQSITNYVPKSKEKLLKVRPDKIAFTSYKRGFVYQQSVYIQNVGSKSANVLAVPFPEQSKFQLKWSEKLGGIIMIAAGLSIAIKVEFHCTSLDDVNDTLILKLEGGNDVLVPITAERLAPILEALQPANMHDPTLWSIVEHGMETTLECGVTLVGESVLETINLYNRGGEGHFWIMTEEEWTHCEIKNAAQNNVLKIPPFTLTPFYFYLRQFEEITLCLFYEPKSQGLQIKNLKILCDNCVIHSLDVLADAIYFESRFISFANLKKTFAIEMDDDQFADYYVNIGRILPNGCAQKSFYISNESDLEFQFRWEVRPIEIYEYPPYSLLHLPIESVSVTPSEGTLSPNLERHFIVKCDLQNGVPGHYRIILSFYVENLPWQSVIRSSHVRKAAVNPYYTNRVDVLLNEIELWAECVPLAVMLQPCIIKITNGKLRCNEEPVLPKLTMANTMLDDIAFQWMHISPPLCEPAAVNTIEMLMNVGTVKAKTFMPCQLKITPVSQGLLMHEIRCSVNEGEHSVEMIICAQVSEPQIYPSEYILNFGNIRKNASASQQLKIHNGSNTEVVWVAREFKYDINAGRLKRILRSGLSVDSGSLSYADSVCTVDYTLDTRSAEIWISILELSVASYSHRYRQHFILVVGDIHKPQLTLSAPTQFTAFLCPPSPLYIGIPVTTNIILCNHSNVSASFKWGVPVGQDFHKLKFDIKPKCDVIQPAGDMMLEVLLIPLQMGSIANFFIPCFIENVQEPIIMGIKCDVKGMTVTFELPAEDDSEKEKSSTVDIPWAIGDQIFFPSDTLTSYAPTSEVTVYPTFNEIIKICEDLQRYKKSKTIAMNSESLRNTEKDTEEQVLQKIDYEVEGKPIFTSVQEDLKVSQIEEDENEYVIMNGKKGKLYSNEEYRLVLHFPLSEDIFSAQSYLFENVDENDPDYESPPHHTYSLANEYTISTSDEDVFNELNTLLLKRTFEMSGDRVSVDDRKRTQNVSPTENDTKEMSKQVNEDGETSFSKREELASDNENKFSNKSSWLEGLLYKAVSIAEEEQASQDKQMRTTEKISKDLAVKQYKPRVHEVHEIFLNDVKVKEVASTKFCIRNETPISTHFEVKATNFPPNSCIEMRDIADSVFCEVPYRERDKLECCILPGKGIAVFIRQCSKTLKPYEIIMIEVSIYANTWGIYNEIVSCNIYGLPPFYIRLTIKVQGSPVYFSIAPPHILSHCPLRFGTVQYGSKPRTRTLIICNESCINIDITWHIFIKKNPCNLSGSREEKPFNIVVDMYTTMEGNDREMNYIMEDNLCNRCKRSNELNSKEHDVIELNIVPYIGTEDYTLFQVYPKETIIQSKSEEIIKVSFDPKVNNCLNSITAVCAVLVGFIKVAPEDIYSRGKFYRPHGVNLQPIWLTLSAEVEVATLTLETDHDDLEFYVEAAHVLSQPNKQFTICRIFLVKNNCKSSVTAFVDTTTPFFITEVDTMAHRHKMIKTGNKEEIAFTLLPDECAEIHVSCIIKEDFVLHIQEAFWTATSKEYSREQIDRFSKKSAIFECPLRIIQPNVMEQIIKMKILLEFPLVTVSTDKVEFGTVCVGDTKWAILEVENKTVTNVWFNITKVYQTNEFSLHPSCGVIPPASSQGCSVLQVKITFSPMEKMSYMDYLRIDTYIPGDEHIVIVDGIGTPDTKFCSNC